MAESKKSRPATYELIAMYGALSKVWSNAEDEHRTRLWELLTLCGKAIEERAEQYDYSTAPIGKLKD